MTGFDAELYLRLCAEDALLARSQDAPWSDPLLERARALLAVGAVSLAIADRVIDDYGRARMLRGLGHHHGAHSHRSSPARPLSARRVVRCDRSIDQPWGQFEVRHATLSSDEIRLAVTLRSNTNPAPRGRSRARPHPFLAGTPTLVVTDDQGTSVPAEFNGGGSDTEWTGHYAAKGLAPTTAWLELLGERIELVDVELDVTVEVEPFDEAELAERYLQHGLEGAAAPHRHGAGSLEPIVDALVACGSLEATSSAVEESLAVADALENFHGGPAAGAPALPEPWRSIITRRGRTGGRRGSLLIGAVTPLFDGVSAALAELRSSDEGFEVELQLTGACMANPFHQSFDRPRITFTAKDDLGNHYLGGFSSSSGGDDTIEGQVEFWPALDPQAARLELALTADRSRAVVHIPLQWSEPA